MDDDQFDLFDLRHLRHSGGLPTELQALSVVAPHLTTMKKAIFEALKAQGEHGLTPDEYAAQRHLLINTVRRRFTDLWKEGIIRHHPEGKTRRNSDLNECIVWIIGIDPWANGTTEQKIKRLRQQLREHGIAPCC
jgi:hypothetical protein